MEKVPHKMRMIISNNCVAGFIYKKLGVKYNHPFMWNVIDSYDYT